MGIGQELKCDNCGFKTEIYQGIGMMDLIIASDYYTKIEEGFYGSFYEQIMKDNPCVEVYISRELFRCSSCGEISSGIEVRLYNPKDVTDEDLRADKPRISFLCLFEDKKLIDSIVKTVYKPIATITPKCNLCKSSTETIKTIKNLRCPRCNKKLTKGYFFCFD